jgi:hypothetical protein
MNGWIERRERRDSWAGRQPRYERSEASGRDRFSLVTRLPSGRPVRVPLGRPAGQLGRRSS